MSNNLNDNGPYINAYHLYPDVQMDIVPAWAKRNWMDDTDQSFANRCLPLLIANQSGWFILNNHEFSVTWTGGHSKDSLTIQSISQDDTCAAISHFGHGILTFHLPYLFRTSPGYNLLVRGPANWPKDGIYPLEGVVETDWLEATFTVNWRMTRINHLVSFKVGEPICMLVPQRRGELEDVKACVLNIEAVPDLQHGYQLWSLSRDKHNQELASEGTEARNQGWQKHYFQGKTLTGETFPEHQTRLDLSKFIKSY